MQEKVKGKLKLTFFYCKKEQVLSVLKISKLLEQNACKKSTKYCDMINTDFLTKIKFCFSRNSFK